MKLRNSVMTVLFVIALLTTGIAVDLVDCQAAASKKINLFSAKFGGKGQSAAGNASGSMARQTKDGGFIIIGADSKAKDFGCSIYIVKTNNMGKKIWEKRIAFDSGDIGEAQGYDIQQISDGGFIATGYRSLEDIYRNCLWVLRLDGNGKTIWEKFFDGGAGRGKQVRLLGYSLVQAADGNFLIAGQIEGQGAYLLKLDKNGSIEWERLFPGARFFAYYGDQNDNNSAYPAIRPVQVTRSGDSYLFGYHTKETYRVLRIDESGIDSKLADIGKSEHDASYPEIGSMIATADGGFAVLGTKRTFGGSKTNTYTFVAKYDSAGTHQWGSIFTRHLTFAGGLVQLPSGGYALSATSSIASAGVSFHRFGVMFVLLDRSGQMTGSKLYGLSTMDNKCASLQSTSDDGFVLAGTYNGDSEAGAYSSMWLLKLNAAGENPYEQQMPQKKAPVGQFFGIKKAVSPETAEGIEERKDGTINLALKKPAKQSSVYGGTGVDQGPHFGVDGILKSIPRDPYLIVHTSADNPPWWQVDLQNVYALTELKLYNRIACCGEKMRTVQVHLSRDGEKWERVYQHDGSNFKILTVNLKGKKARYVKLQLAERVYLHFQECEVYGYPESVR
ncbi:MAG: hypothetical protein CSYNP_01851 [Syntrophus sp. SKADARSKE-3]|nr:hypothetical protein [Syntrophus sp. SKADARSKE-3]